MYLRGFDENIGTQENIGTDLYVFVLRKWKTKKETAVTLNHLTL